MSLTGGSKFILTGGANYQIARSLRFRAGATAHFKRTFAGAPTSASIGTFSGWVKRGTIASAARQHLLSGYDGSSSFESVISFETDDTLAVQWGGSAANLRKTAALFRDPSAFMHVCIGFTGGTITIEVNGVTQTLSGTAGSGNHQFVKANANNTIGGGWNNPAVDRFCDLLLADLYYIDGQVLAASNFGQTDATTGAWNPIKYTGTYGTNGFYLPFSDNSAATSTTIGKDSSGNGNNWTPSGISITAGVTNDSLVDVPTNYGSDTGAGGEVRGNYATLNPLNKDSVAVLSSGNLEYLGQASGADAFITQVAPSGVPIYFEVEVKRDTGSSNPSVGFTTKSQAGQPNPAVNGDVMGCVWKTGTTWDYYKIGTTASQGTFTAADGDILGFAINPLTQKAWLRLNSGAYVGGGDPAAGTSPTWTGFTQQDLAIYCRNRIDSYTKWNFGQRAFAHTAPSGFKALCTQNLPDPAIAKPSLYMDVNTRTGTGAAFNVTGKGFQPDLVWSKGRSGATDHAIYDAVRTATKDLGSNLATDETTQAQGLTAFNSDGFSGGTLAKINTSAATYVDWMWKKGAAPGIDVVSYTGNGANRTIAHTLGVVPSMMIVKSRVTAGADTGWAVYHSALANTEYLKLETTAAKATGATYWNSTTPTSSVFSLGTAADTNTNSDTYINYLFAEVAGFSKFGSYVGNGSAVGPFVFCGFRPRFVLFKSTGAGEYWHIGDTARSTYNAVDAALRPNLSNAEALFSTSVETWDILSNGFKLRGTGGGNNASAVTYIFAAFAEHPFKTARAR